MTLSHVFSFLPHLTVGLVVCQGICGGISDAPGMGPLLTGVYHPHFTVLRVTDILLHTVRGGVHQGVFPSVAVLLATWNL